MRKAYLVIILNIVILNVIVAETVNPNDKSKYNAVQTSNVQSFDSEENEETSVKIDEDKMVLFNPTNDWQEVKSYHKLPHGLHIRMNLQTGLKEAKILSETEESERDETSNLAVLTEDANGSYQIPEESEAKIKLESSREEILRENIVEALKNIKNEDPEQSEMEDEKALPRIKIRKKPKFRSYNTLKEEFEGLHLKIESDSEILKGLIIEYGQSDDELKLGIIEDLEFLIHQIDNAVNFVGIGGLKKVIQPGLNSSNSDVRKGVMKLLGSATQSNPKVQIAAFEEGLLSHLLRIVGSEKDLSISAKAVFALSCLVRGFPYGQQKLIESGGLHALREVFLKQDWQAMTLQLKVVSLIQDLLEERANAEGERARQLSKLDLMSSLVEGEWCSAVSSLLTGASFDKRGQREDLRAALGKGVPLRPDHDVVDKVINTMTLLVPSCETSFFPFLPLLRYLKDTYSELAYKERYQGQDGHEFFQGLANQIQFLLLKIARKEEL